jgi:hypothetical protein
MRADFMATLADEEIERQFRVGATENRHHFACEIYEKFTIQKGEVFAGDSIAYRP